VLTATRARQDVLAFTACNQLYFYAWQPTRGLEEQIQLAKPGRKKDKANRGTEAGARPTKPARELAGKPPFFGLEKVPFESGAEAKEPKPAPAAKKNECTLETPKGPVHVENYCPVAKLEGLTVDDGILMFSRHNPERQKKALVNVAGDEGGNVAVATFENLLVGYIGIHHPSEGERWGKPSYPWMYELGAIEVSRNFRERGLSMAMMHAAWDDPFYDDKVVITTAFTWHWDLEATGMTKLEYRELFIELAGRFGFMEMTTDEPNVMMDSANLFLVRLGRDTTFSQYQKFAALLFTNEWEAMLRGF
jgi:acetoin utilization protein AcuA